MDMNIYELIRHRKQHLPEPRVKQYMYQVIKAVEHMHRNNIFHRDIKPENVLILDDKLKVADFGSCRGIHSKPPYTEYISTRWYRAPECILTDGHYDFKMDIWGVGCVFFEVLALFPLFPGSNEMDQLDKIHAILGTPKKEIKMKRLTKKFNFTPKEGTGIRRLLPHVSEQCADLIEKMCAYHSEDRITAKGALTHPYFKELVEADQDIPRSAPTGKELNMSGELKVTATHKEIISPKHEDESKRDSKKASLVTTNNLSLIIKPMELPSIVKPVAPPNIRQTMPHQSINSLANHLNSSMNISHHNPVSNYQSSVSNHNNSTLSHINGGGGGSIISKIRSGNYNPHPTINPITQSPLKNLNSQVPLKSTGPLSFSNNTNPYKSFQDTGFSTSITSVAKPIHKSMKPVHHLASLPQTTKLR